MAPQTPQTQPPTLKKSRLPRFMRVKNPPRIVLTERDQEILRSVYAFRLMTREQIERLLFAPGNGQDHFTKTSQVRRRLKLLYHHRYLERIPTPIRPGYWAWRPVYRLGKEGAKLIAAQMELPLSKLPYWGNGFDKDARTSQISLLFLSHVLRINDVRIQILLEAKAKRFQVETWIDDTILKAQKMKDSVQIINNGRGYQVPVIPDAYFVLNLGDRRAHFFLELDQATMSLKRWQSKALAYKAYIASGKYQERYHTQSLRILTVTTSRQRLDHLKKVTEKAGGDQAFWFTTYSQVMEESIHFSPIWQVAGQKEIPPALIF